MDLIEESFHWFLGIPCLADVLKVLLKLHSHDADIREKEVTKHTSHGYVSKTDHAIVQFFEVHWFKYYYGFLKRLLQGVV